MKTAKLFRLTPQECAWIKRTAKELGWSEAMVVRWLIRKAMEERE